MYIYNPTVIDHVLSNNTSSFISQILFHVAILELGKGVITKLLHTSSCKNSVWLMGTCINILAKF